MEIPFLFPSTREGTLYEPTEHRPDQARDRQRQQRLPGSREPQRPRDLPDAGHQADDQDRRRRQPGAAQVAAPAPDRRPRPQAGGLARRQGRVKDDPRGGRDVME